MSQIPAACGGILRTSEFFSGFGMPPHVPERRFRSWYGDCITLQVTAYGVGLTRRSPPPFGPNTPIVARLLRLSFFRRGISRFREWLRTESVFSRRRRGIAQRNASRPPIRLTKRCFRLAPQMPHVFPNRTWSRHNATATPPFGPNTPVVAACSIFFMRTSRQTKAPVRGTSPTVYETRTPAGPAQLVDARPPFVS